MSRISRNAPCACGSGRKYKQCCLRREDEWQSHRAHLRAGAEAALDWLRRDHTETVEAAVAEEFLGCLNEEDRKALAAFGRERVEMIHVNASDWLLAEARLRVPGGRRRFASRLVLDAGGLLLTMDQRDHVQAIATSPLRLYEVTAVERGTGIEVRDLLASSAPAVRVRDTSLSQSLERWETIALRLVPCRGGAIPTCVYHYPPTHGTWLLEQIRQRLSDHPRALGTRGITQAGQREVSAMLRDSWLFALIPPKRMPQVVDARTGDPILLVEDHFRVSDWERLEAVLAEQTDVEGERGEGWRRMEFHEGRPPRPGWNLRVGPQPDTVIGFARTAKAADANRAWLESVAGDAVRFLLRDSMDPTSPAAQEVARREKPEPEFLQTLPREERGRLMQQLHEQIYERWADEPVPLLGGKTPRELVETATGRERVARLLKDYEAGEARRAREEGRDPVDFGFLWARVGLSCEDASIR